jgi:hypothetical protein
LDQAGEYDITIEQGSGLALPLRYEAQSRIPQAAARHPDRLMLETDRERLVDRDGAHLVLCRPHVGVAATGRAPPLPSRQVGVHHAVVRASRSKSIGMSSAMAVNESGSGSSADGESEEGIDRSFERTGTPLSLGE